MTLSKVNISAEGGNRTRTPLRAGDFESPASTYFTTSAAGMNLNISRVMSTILQMRYQDHF